MDGSMETARALEADRTPEFYEATSQLEQALSRLEGLVETMGDKLMPITSPSPPSAAPSETPVDSRYTTSVARTIESYYSRVDKLTDVVASMTKRVEL